MNDEQAKALRAPFPTEAIGKLPKVTCRACSQNKQQKHCGDHQRAKCNVCRNYISTAHLHLDYVGHAEITDRLLQVDPEWSWEPLAFDDAGLPAMDRVGGMWIRLTVAGVTRLGYGSADGKEGPDAIKEIIGDALRNAGMRFGIALDLWGAHGVGQDDTADEPAVGRGQAPQQRNGQQRKQPAPEDTVQAARGTLSTLCKARKLTIEAVDAEYRKRSGGKSLGDETSPAAVRSFIEGLNSGSITIPADEPAGASS